MAKTKVSDIIVPAIFAPYALERTANLSAILSAGIVGMDPEFDRLASSGGSKVDMPYWKDLLGNSEVLSDSASLTVNAITTGQDTAAINNRGKAWGSNILSKLLSGEDPMRTIADLVGGFWARDMQTTLIQILTGLFDGTSGVLRTTHRLNLYSDVVSGGISDAMRFTGDTFVDATVKLGDSGGQLVAIAMHSD